MDWLQKMASAMRNLSYQGRFVYIHENQLESMSIIHIKDQSGERERLFSLNGEAREIIRNNNSLICIWPSSRKVVVDQARQQNLSPLWVPTDVNRLGKFYDFKLVGEARIADHEAVVINITPMDEFRYGLIIWINNNNGLLLKSVMLDNTGEVLEQVMFTNLTIVEDVNTMSVNLVPAIDESYSLVRSHVGGGPGKLAMESEWKLLQLPIGFWRESAYKREVERRGKFVEQMVFTDGLATLSVFIEPVADDSLQGFSSMGAVNAYSYISDGFAITAIGEVPAITVKQIASSMQRTTK